jgi:hypothetical protein
MIFGDLFAIKQHIFDIVLGFKFPHFARHTRNSRQGSCIRASAHDDPLWIGFLVQNVLDFWKSIPKKGPRTLSRMGTTPAEKH